MHCIRTSTPNTLIFSSPRIYGRTLPRQSNHRASKNANNFTSPNNLPSCLLSNPRLLSQLVNFIITSRSSHEIKVVKTATRRVNFQILKQCLLIVSSTPIVPLWVQTRSEKRIAQAWSTGTLLPLSTSLRTHSVSSKWLTLELESRAVYPFPASFQFSSLM